MECYFCKKAGRTMRVFVMAGTHCQEKSGFRDLCPGCWKAKLRAGIKCPLCDAEMEDRPDGLVCPNCGAVEQ